MDKFLRALIISGLVIITLVLLGWEYVLSILPEQSKSGNEIIGLLWGCTAVTVFLIVVFSRIGKKTPEDEVLDSQNRVHTEIEQGAVFDPAKERSRKIFLALIAMSMLILLGIAAYAYGIF